MNVLKEILDALTAVNCVYVYSNLIGSVNCLVITKVEKDSVCNFRIPSWYREGVNNKVST